DRRPRRLDLRGRDVPDDPALPRGAAVRLQHAALAAARAVVPDGRGGVRLVARRGRAAVRPGPAARAAVHLRNRVRGFVPRRTPRDGPAAAAAGVDSAPTAVADTRAGALTNPRP